MMNQFRILSCRACLAAAFLAFAETRADDLGHKQGERWFPFVQWTLDNPSWEGNAFDVVASVRFRHAPSGEERRTEMFYMGDQKWAFRFTGTRLGDWSFVTGSEDPELDGRTGHVSIVKNSNPTAHGFLKHFGNKWGWQGTETAFVPQLAMWDYAAGNSNPKMFHEKPALVEAMIDEFIHGHGFNGFHIPVIGGRWFDIDAENERVNADMSEPDVRTFEALELLIVRLHRAGGMAHIWPWGDDSRAQTPLRLEGGIGGAIDRRLQRYIAARLGPIPGWSMGYGFDLDEWVAADQLRAWRDAMHFLFGWPHFLGGRPEGPNRGTDHRVDGAWNVGLDYYSYEHHRPDYQVYRAALTVDATHPVLSEDRFRIRDSRYREKDYNTERVRRGLYHSTLAGGVGNIWGIHPDSSEGGIFPNKEEIKTYAVFFHEKARFLPDMTPANHLSADQNARVLWSPKTKSLVLYRENTDMIQVDLSGMPGPTRAIAVNTKSEYREHSIGFLESKRQTLSLPSTSDWVVALGDFE